MSRDEFLAAVRRLGIRSDAYNLDGEGDEQYVLARDGQAWEIFYSERGTKTGVRRFDTESDALGHLLTVLENDRSTRLIA
jgi:hypothetical protein